MNATTTPAEILLRACGHARSLRGRIWVVKLGGSAMEEPEATRSMLASLVALQTLGLRIVVVHGGGKPIDRAMAAAGLEPKKVAGRRYTDEAVLQVVMRVLDEINRDIVAELNALGGDAISERQVLAGTRLVLPGPDLQPIDLGRVGTVTLVATVTLHTALTAGKIPVIPCLARSTEDDGWLNVNADTAAAAVAGAMSAECCYFLTDTPGVLRQRTDPGSRIQQLTRQECQTLIESDIIADGMIPKVQACLDALDAGANRAVILDGRERHSLLAEFVSESIPGTILCR